MPAAQKPARNLCPGPVVQDPENKIHVTDALRTYLGYDAAFHPRCPDRDVRSTGKNRGVEVRSDHVPRHPGV